MLLSIYISVVLLSILLVSNSFIIYSQRRIKSSFLLNDVLPNQVNVEFLPSSNEFKPSMIQAKVTDKLSDVAEAASVTIPYKCRKGECKTCEVRVAGKWITTCQSTVADVVAISPDPLNLSITVRPANVKKPSKFFSPRSFVEGVYNNGLGVIGFVWRGLSENNKFKERMQKEEELKLKVATKKAQLEAQTKGQT